MKTQIPAKISFKVEKLAWNNVEAIIDLHESEIQCELELSADKEIALNMFGDRILVTEFSLFYNTAVP